MKISCIINKSIEPIYGTKRKGQKRELDDYISENHSGYNEFERRVFNYLFENRAALGIKKVYRLTNASVDGLLELDNREMILLEIKSALGWAYCCQARIQIQRFLTEKLHDKLAVKKPDDALIIFQKFVGSDWRQRGWDLFYEEENVLSGDMVKTHIAQLTNDGSLISYGEAVGVR
jgi:hypothetical protein